MTTRGRPPGSPRDVASILALVGANLIPLFGALAWGWDAYHIVVLYWVENVIVGALNVLKILVARPFAEGADPSKLSHHAEKILLVPFFVVHYGLFTAVHGVFLAFLLGRDDLLSQAGGPFAALPVLFGTALSGGGAFAVLALAASHTLSFFQNFLAGGEWRTKTSGDLLFAPYGRVVVLHLAILLGAAGAQAAGSPLPLLALLVAGKTLLDLYFHRRAHATGAPSPSPRPFPSTRGDP